MVVHDDAHVVTKSKQAWRLGPRLKRAREGQNLSQREAARAAGISVTTWGQLETGIVKKGGGLESPMNPRAAIVIAAANVVGLDPAEALRLVGIDPSSHDLPAGRPTVSQQEVLDLFARMGDEQRRALLGLLRSLVGAVGGGGRSQIPALGPSDKQEVSRTSSEQVD